MKSSLMALLVAGGSVLACSSAPRAVADAGDCLLSRSDSTYLAGGPVFRDCAVDVRAEKTARMPRIEFRPTRLPSAGTQCFTAELEFVVDAKGAPETKTTRILRTNDLAFAEAVLASLAAVRYTPAQKDSVPVRQIVRERSAMALVVSTGGAGVPPTRPATPVC